MHLNIFDSRSVTNSCLHRACQTKKQGAKIKSEKFKMFIKSLNIKISTKSKTGDNLDFLYENSK